MISCFCKNIQSVPNFCPKHCRLLDTVKKLVIFLLFYKINMENRRSEKKAISS